MGASAAGVTVGLSSASLTGHLDRSQSHVAERRARRMCDVFATGARHGRHAVPHKLDMLLVEGQFRRLGAGRLDDPADGMDQAWLQGPPAIGQA